METGKTGKYLKYAIGEIILVVFGILIALQINNWNDQKKSETSEFRYYNRILADFELEKKLIDELSQKADERINRSKALLIDLDSGTKNKKYLMNQLLAAIRSEAYVPRNVTFKELTSSGNLKLLNDVAIKTSLIQFYSELENKQSQLKQNRDEMVKSTFELVNSSIAFGSQEFDYVSVLLGPEIMQILPQEDWEKDKNSESYKKFQFTLLFNITMAAREKQHLAAIHNFMEIPYQLLSEKCKKQ